MNTSLRTLLIVSLAVFISFPLIVSAQRKGAGKATASNAGTDWNEWRGPYRDGTSSEKGLPEKWSMQGENLVWKMPFGGRSTPIVMGNRVFLFNSSGHEESLQERVMCFDADSGKVLWEYKFTVYSSDVPPRRVAWSSPAGDPETGNIYIFGANGTVLALSQQGKLVWERSLTDEFGAWTTHGGRTVSPIIEGHLVIVSMPTDGYNDLAQRRHRFFAFDKRTGECVWISTPGDRPYDTTYSAPIVATVNGTRLMIAGGGDGAVHAIKVNTGEPVWKYPMSKRGINPGVVIKDNIVFVSHQEENLDTSEMGHLAALDATAKGTVSGDKIKWSIRNYQLGPSTPVIDGERYYHVDAGSNLFAFDLNNGRKLWEQNLGTIQKASPVFADGKLYVGTENGTFYILKPSATGCEILNKVELEPGAKLSEALTANDRGDDLIASNEQIIASPAVSHGRVYFVSTKAIYCIGKKGKTPAFTPTKSTAIDKAPADAAVAHVQLVPADALLKPGESVKFKVNLFDDHGRFIREETSATWSLDGLKGAAQNNQFTAATDAGAQAGKVKATVGNVSGIAFVRSIPMMPMTENFDTVAPGKVPTYWINTDGKYAVREMDGGKVLVKNPNPPIFKRGRALFGPASWSNYTVEAQVRATEKRRQMGDAGVVAQRYTLVLFGNSQKMELQSWQIEPKRTITKSFQWKADTWYHVKLQVENLPDGRVRARGKAWPAAEAEPAEWTIERIDAPGLGNRQGSPGIYADAPNDVLFDNVKVTPNK